MSVQVKKGVVRESPSFLSSVIITLNYGDHVTTLKQEGDWFEVKGAKKKGWMHASALNEKEVVLAVGTTKAQKSVSSNELVMAGKGFSSQVESEYRAQNHTLRFDLVNRMEALTIPLNLQRSFAVDGQLKY
jgi:uncharacterized protein YgiM (DUF1202 family)